MILDEVHLGSCHDLLDHTFYQRRVVGELSIGELGHVPHWRKFSNALGISPNEVTVTIPNSAAADLPRRGDEVSAAASRSRGRRGARGPESCSKRREAPRGFKSYCGNDPHGGGEYFDVHSSRDLEHTADLDAVMSGLEKEQFLEAQRTADPVLAGLWDLLTSGGRAA